MRTNNRAFFRIFSSLFLFAMILFPPVSTIAVSGDGLIAYPSNPDPDNSATESWFIYNLDREQSKQDSLTVKNNSDEKQTIKIYAVDSTTNNVGEFALEAEKDSKDGIGKWITLEKNSVTLEPKEEQQVNFTIDIPANALPGEIAGGIIIQKETAKDPNESQSGFIITTRIGIRIYETVPGEVIKKVSFGDSTLEYDKKEKLYTLNVILKNEGNVSIEPDVKVDIKDTFFGTQNQQLEQKTSIPREGEVKATFTFNKPKVGKFEIIPEATYQKTNGTHETVISNNKISFWALPWDEIIIIFLLIAANLFFLLILKILSKKEKRYYKSYRVEDGENLETIATKLGTDWKKIAKINKLKIPYQLSGGQIITVFDKKDMLEQLYLENEKLSETTKKSEKLNEKTTEKKPEIASTPIKKSFLAKVSEKMRVRKDICFLVIIGFALLIIGYSLCANTFIKKNNLNFNYNSANQNTKEISGMPEPTQIQNIKDEQTGDMPEKENQISENEISGEKINKEERESVDIEILNGSGIKGASLEISSALEKKGYTKISSGNADNFNYTDTSLTCASAVNENICGEIEKVLSEDHQNVRMTSNNESETNSIKIILGK